MASFLDLVPRFVMDQDIQVSVGSVPFLVRTCGMIPDKHTIYGESTCPFIGVFDCIPSVCPTSADAFRGVNRSLDSNKLAGLRICGIGLTFEQQIKFANAYLYNHGAKATHFFYNPRHQNIPGLLHSVMDEFKGKIELHPDEGCPVERGLMTQLDTWQLGVSSDGKSSALYTLVPLYSANVEMV